MPIELDPGDLFDNRDKIVNRDEFGRPNIYRLSDVAFHEPQSPFDAIGDIRETPGLPAVTPNIDVGRS